MNDIKYIVSRELSINISAEDADRLIARRDGTAALLYIYLLRNSGSFQLSEASARLGINSTELRRAADVLQAMKMLEISSIPVPEESLPEYTHEEISSKTMDSTEFKSLVAEAQSILGKVLSTTELRTLFGIYDYLALPPEVIMMLISYCLERTRKRSGMGKLPTMRTIEREGYVWANREILTLEMAESHLQYLAKMESETGKIKQALGIHERELVPTERKYIENWIALGFTAEPLAMAYEKTVLKTGKLQWKYMNSIVSSWHSKNLHSIEEIQGGDKMPITGGYKPAGRANTPDMGDILNMEKLLDKMKNN